jgi:hypothetical protein
MTILPLMLLIYSKCAKFRNSNLISLRKYKNQEKIKRIEHILSRLVIKVFQNDNVSLVKIQIYSNSIFRK